MGKSLEKLILDRSFFRTWLLYLLIFSIAMVIEVIFYGKFKNPFLQEVINRFKSTVPSSINPVLLFVIIFFHNFIVATIALIFSPTFIIPAAILAFNGVVVGYVISLGFNRLGVAGSVIGLIPHGGIETSAIALAAASGIFIRKGFRSYMFSATTIGLIVYILLIIAALTESVITSSLLLFTLWIR